MKKPSPTRKKGIQAVADMLNAMEESHRERLIKNLEEKDPELLRKIRKEMFVFEDLKLLTDQEFQILFRDSEMELWLLALRRSSSAMKAKVMSNISTVTRAVIKEEMDARGLRKLSDVATAQEKLVEAARQLAQQNKIALPEGKT